MLLFASYFFVTYVAAQNPFVWPEGQSGFDTSVYMYGGFLPTPQTSSAATAAGMTSFRTCKDTLAAGQTKANIMWKGDNRIVMPFYNALGQLAGVIQSTPFKDWKSWGTSAPLVKYENAKTGVFYGLEVHFRDPKTLCDDKATKKTDVIGDRVWFRNGNTDSFLKAPLTQDETLLTELGWTKGKYWKCMGTHWMRGLNHGDKTYPIVLLYDDDLKLIGWHGSLSDKTSLEANVLPAPWEGPRKIAVFTNFQENQATTLDNMENYSDINRRVGSLHHYLRDPAKKLVTNPEPFKMPTLAKCMDLTSELSWLCNIAAANPTDQLAGANCCFQNERIKTTGCYCHPAFGPNSLVPQVKNAFVGVEAKCSGIWPKQCGNYVPNCATTQQTKNLGCPVSDQLLETQRYGTVLAWHSVFQVSDFAERNKRWSALYNQSPLPTVNAGDLGIYTGIPDILEYLNIASPKADLNTYQSLGTRTKFSRNSCQNGDKLTYQFAVVEQWWRGEATNSQIYEGDAVFAKCSPLIQSQQIDFHPISVDFLFKSQDKPWYAPAELCKTIQANCVGKNAQFKSQTECVTFWKTLPRYSKVCGELRKGQGYSSSCKFLHLFLTKENPDIHCWHVGRGIKADPNGKFKCSDKYCDVLPTFDDCKQCPPEQCVLNRLNTCPGHENTSNGCQLPGNNCYCEAPKPLPTPKPTSAPTPKPSNAPTKKPTPACQANATYSTCGPACPETCRRHGWYWWRRHYCAKKKCVAGCVCNKGYVKHGKRCIKKSKCWSWRWIFSHSSDDETEEDATQFADEQKR